jgi:hypothetical protein
MKHNSHANGGTTPRLPKKPVPNTEWNSPAFPVTLYQGQMPAFPQLDPSGTSQQPFNPGYQFGNDNLDIFGTTYCSGSQDSGDVTSNFNKPSQPDVQFQNNNAVGFQQEGIRQRQTGTSGELYFPTFHQFGR